MESQHTKKAVLYCRVSTKEQVEEGNSLATQEKNCREYALKNGYEITAVFIEQGESAKTADRTELKKLMKFCATQKLGVTAVIAYKIDRISRNTADYSLIRIQLKRYGIEIKSTTEFFEDNPAGRFMENIIANVAQFDNDVRTERSIGGMRDAVREGRYVWKAPYGYSNVRVSGKSTITPSRSAQFVRKAFEEIAQNIYPSEVVRKKLIADGFINGSSGKPISKSYFYYLLRNKTYTGWINKFGEINKGCFEPLISIELFNRVQWVLSDKRGKNKQYMTESPDFPLRRFFTHPNGQMLTGGWAKGRVKKYPYYLFHKLKINIRKEILELKFKALLNSFQIDDQFYEKLLAQVKMHLDGSSNDKKVEIEQLKNKILKLKNKQLIIIEKNIEGIINNELSKEMIAKIDNEIYQLNQLIILKPKETTNYSRLLNIIQNILKNPGETWENAGIKHKIKLQWFYFPHGVVFDGFESQTTKICKLFKLKEYFSSFRSYMGGHLNSQLNTTNKLITLPGDQKTDIQSAEFWEQVGEELVVLNEIVKSKASVDLQAE